jgi:hypothetical protein
MPCPNRKTAKTYLTPEEYEQVAGMAKQAGISLSTFIKRVCLGQELRSRTDQEAVMALVKANADLGRLGGLFKMGLSDGSAGKMAAEFRHTLRQIEKSQAQVAKDCRAMLASLKGRS